MKYLVFHINNIKTFSFYDKSGFEYWNFRNISMQIELHIICCFNSILIYISLIKIKMYYKYFFMYNNGISVLYWMTLNKRISFRYSNL